MEPKIKVAHRIRNNYRKAAKKSKRVFELSTEDVANIIFLPCKYCGDQGCHQDSATGLIYNGIDRTENDSGYIVANCRPCCVICNKAKRAMSEADFFDHVWNIYASLSMRGFIDAKIR